MLSWLKVFRLFKTIFLFVGRFFIKKKRKKGLLERSKECEQDAFQRFPFIFRSYCFLLEEATEMVDEACYIDGPAKKIYDVIQRWCSCALFYFYQDYTCGNPCAYNENRER